MIDPLYGVKCLKLGFDIYILDIAKSERLYVVAIQALHSMLIKVMERNQQMLEHLTTIPIYKIILKVVEHLGLVTI